MIFERFFKVWVFSLAPLAGESHFKTPSDGFGVDSELHETLSLVSEVEGITADDALGLVAARRPRGI